MRMFLSLEISISPHRHGDKNATDYDEILMQKQNGDDSYKRHFLKQLKNKPLTEMRHRRD